MKPCPDHPLDGLPRERCFMCAVSHTLERKPEVVVITKSANRGKSDRVYVAQVHVKRRR